LGLSVESRLNLKPKKMKRLKKGEKGFTLLEVIVVAAITGLITSGIATAIFQTFTLSTRTSNHMVAVREVQEAGYWVSLYSYMANDIEITGESGFPIILRWIDFETNKKHRVVFSLEDEPGGGLRGSYYVDDVLDPLKTGQIPVFEYIKPDETNCKLGGGSAFNLTDIGDAFNITGEATPDNGRIIVRTGSIAVTTTGGATYDSGTGEWTTTTTGDNIAVTATSAGTGGSWTSETQAVAAAITVDSGTHPATLSTGRVLIFTVTATVGTGRQEASESRVYEVVPKPVS
jgi:prepilin-type N-terminal cleavage/methylation domain-containing protein